MTQESLYNYLTHRHDHWQGRPRIHDQPPLVCVPIIIKCHRYRYAEEFIDLSEVYTLGRLMVVRSSVFFSQYKRYEWTRVYVYRYRSICMCLQLNFKFVDWITHPFRDLLNSYLSLKESPLADTVYNNVPESVLSPTWMQYWRVQVSLHLRIQVFRLAALIERFRNGQLAPTIYCPRGY